MKVILSSNPFRDKGMKAAKQVAAILEKNGVECCFCLPFELGSVNPPEMPADIQVKQLHQELAGADVLVCFGGDGTILHAAKDATSHGVPILGVNMGSIGFMAELEESELSLVGLISSGNYTVEERMMLQVRAYRGKQLIYEQIALNDAVISKGSIARVAELDVMADETFICHLSGDGVIVATPTGSTAYSMSAGGPIVEPTSDALIITPVCAHQLSARPLVMSAKRNITVQMPRRSRKSVYLSTDGGKAIRLSGTDRVEICMADCRTQLIRLTGKNFYQQLNQKLGGGRM